MKNELSWNAPASNRKTQLYKRVNNYSSVSWICHCKVRDQSFQVKMKFDLASSIIFLYNELHRPCRLDELLSEPCCTSSLARPLIILTVVHKIYHMHIAVYIFLLSTLSNTLIDIMPHYFVIFS